MQRPRLSTSNDLSQINWLAIYYNLICTLSISLGWITILLTFTIYHIPADRETILLWFTMFVMQVFKFLQTFSLSSSNYMILALSVERHKAVTKPLSVASSPYRHVPDYIIRPYILTPETVFLCFVWPIFKLHLKLLTPLSITYRPEDLHAKH